MTKRVCAVFVLLLLAASLATAQEVGKLVYEDDFWFDRPGEFPGGWAIDKEDRPDLKAVLTVADAPAGFDDDVVMRLVDQTGEGRLTTPAFESSAQRLLIETQILVTQEDYDKTLSRRGEGARSDIQGPRIMLRKAGVWPPYADFSTNVGAGVGALGILDNGSQGWLRAHSGIPVGEVTKVSLLIDLEAKTFKVALNDEWLPEVMPFRNLSASGGPYTINLYMHPDWYASAFVGPIRVYEVK